MRKEILNENFVQYLFASNCLICQFNEVVTLKPHTFIDAAKNHKKFKLSYFQRLTNKSA